MIQVYSFSYLGKKATHFLPNKWHITYVCILRSMRNAVAELALEHVSDFEKVERL